MFTGADVEAVVSTLRAHRARLYHACQLVDFRSYLVLGGITSRGRLEQAGLAFTRFRSDPSDRALGVWDLVFLNLEDFTQERFANGVWGTPNPYGPILLEPEPEALVEAAGVAICLRSASGAGFDMRAEGLKDTSEVGKIFCWTGSPRIRDTYALRAAFPDRPAEQVKSVELICAVDGGVLSFDQVRLVRVDPYPTLGTPLVELVQQEAAAAATDWLRVFERDQFAGDRRAVLEALGEELLEHPAALEDLAGSSSGPLAAWAEQIRDRPVSGYFAAYATYLRDGTLLPAAAALAEGCDHRIGYALDYDVCPECGNRLPG